jgi:hypothetical protein
VDEIAAFSTLPPTERADLLFLIENHTEVYSPARSLRYSQDDPVLIFDWNDLNVTRFCDAALAAGLPPAPFVVPSAGAADRLRMFKLALLNLIHAPLAPPRNGTAALYGSLLQFAHVVAELTKFSLSPWVRAVMGPAPYALAAMYVPRAVSRVHVLDRMDLPPVWV